MLKYPNFWGGFLDTNNRLFIKRSNCGYSLRHSMDEGICASRPEQPTHCPGFGVRGFFKGHLLTTATFEGHTPLPGGKPSLDWHPSHDPLKWAGPGPSAGHGARQATSGPSYGEKLVIRPGAEGTQSSIESSARCPVAESYTQCKT